jgi:hypothetical protein
VAGRLGYDPFSRKNLDRQIAPLINETNVPSTASGIGRRLVRFPNPFSPFFPEQTKMHSQPIAAIMHGISRKWNVQIVGREVVQRSEKALEFGMYQAVGGMSW